MTFVSYSQNNEDVLLWRTLGHIQNGFYIDVGANDPVEHSVTKAFYDAGWRGINIEPLPVHQQAFAEQRERDINLGIAAGATDGELTLYDVPAVRGWASPDPSVADLHRSEGHEVAEVTVPVRTLASVCEQYVTGEIHFLKIDVEGFEGEVLRGMDFARWRPWVLVVEATLPNSRDTNHAQWDHLITSQRYRFAWFDGLNRYYVADEHAELLAHLTVQPNVFDEFISYHLDRAWAAERTLTEGLRATEAHAGQLAANVTQLAENERKLNDQLIQVDRHVQNLLAQLEETHARLVHEREHAGQLQGALDHERAARIEAEACVAPLKAEMAQLREHAAQLQLQAHQLGTTLQAMERSLSWRVTRPLRFVWGRARAALRLPRKLLVAATRNETVRRIVLPIVLDNPALHRRVKAILNIIKGPQAQSADAASAHEPQVPEALRDLPVSVRTTLADLQRARQSRTDS